jgi:hypothetical protein
MDKRGNNENLKYINQKLLFVQNLKNDIQILWLAQFHWQTLYYFHYCFLDFTLHLKIYFWSFSTKVYLPDLLMFWLLTIHSNL